jgi:hypothetical protein
VAQVVLLSGMFDDDLVAAARRSRLVSRRFVAAVSRIPAPSAALGRRSDLSGRLIPTNDNASHSRVKESPIRGPTAHKLIKMCWPLASTNETSFFSRAIPILSSVRCETQEYSLPVATKSFATTTERVRSMGFSSLHLL